jgi:hypothetical protein
MNLKSLYICLVGKDKSVINVYNEIINVLDFDIIVYFTMTKYLSMIYFTLKTENVGKLTSSEIIDRTILDALCKSHLVQFTNLLNVHASVKQ